MGVYRVGGSRVALDLVVRACNRGATAEAPAANDMLHANLSEILRRNPARALPLDLFMCYRLLLCRAPEFSDTKILEQRTSITDVRGLVYGILQSEEFRELWRSGGVEIPEVPVMAEVGGLKLWFYLRDRIVGWAAAQGGYEPEVANQLRARIRPEMVCCDLGANIGYFTLLMARAGARVYAFEPFPKNFSLLERNVRENGLESRVQVRQAAVLDRSGTASLCADANDSDYVAMFVAATQRASEGFRQTCVPAVTLDEAVPEQERVGCIKMDIEGSEPLAIAGMTRILERDRPVILFEYNPYCIETHCGARPEEMIAALIRRGYAITRLDGSKWSSSGEGGLENLIAEPVPARR